MKNDKVVIRGKRVSAATKDVRSEARPVLDWMQKNDFEEDPIIPFIPSSVVLEVEYDSHFKLRDEAELLFAV